MDKYDYVFRWMKNATKAERHIDEMETFAKKHPIIFWKFHRASKGIIENDVNDEKSLKAKLLYLFYKGKINKARKDFPLMDNILNEHYSKISQLEKDCYNISRSRCVCAWQSKTGSIWRIRSNVT